MFDVYDQAILFTEPSAEKNANLRLFVQKHVFNVVSHNNLVPDALRLRLAPICAESALDGRIGLSILVRYHGHLEQHESCDRSFPEPKALDHTAPVCAHDPYATGAFWSQISRSIAPPVEIAT